MYSLTLYTGCSKTYRQAETDLNNQLWLLTANSGYENVIHGYNKNN